MRWWPNEQLDMIKAKAVITPGVKTDSKLGTEEGRRVHFLDANDSERNLIVEEALESDEIMPLHGWTPQC